MFLPDFLASWAASACGTIIMHPVDTLRVRYQTRNHSPLFTLRNERWIALYSGMLTPVTVGGPINALVFMSNDGIKEAVYRMLLRAGVITENGGANGNGAAPANSGHLSSSTAYASSSSSSSNAALMGPKLPMWAVLLSGGAAGCVGTLVACPAATIRVQQQVRAISSHLGGASGGGAEGAAATSSTSAAAAQQTMGKRNLAPVQVVIRDLFVTEGVRGFYRAVSLECLTNFVGRSTYFGLYEGFKRGFGAAYAGSSFNAAPKKGADGASSSAAKPLTADEAGLLVSVRIAAASTSSVLSWFSIYPLDLVKNKLQAEPTVRAERLYGNGSVRECARLTYKAGGWRAFYVGFPITAVRGSCTGMINLPLYDSLKPIFRKQMSPPGGDVEMGEGMPAFGVSPPGENSG